MHTYPRPNGRGSIEARHTSLVRYPAFRSPRLFSCGPIEAFMELRGAVTVILFSWLLCCGPIEAATASTVRQPFGHLHGCSAVAPLKLRLPNSKVDSSITYP